VLARDAVDGFLEHDGIKGGESAQVQRQPGPGRVPIGTIPARPPLPSVAWAASSPADHTEEAEAVAHKARFANPQALSVSGIAYGTSVEKTLSLPEVASAVTAK
jgi:hypothetical protein